jgi:hypothetical protein
MLAEKEMVWMPQQRKHFFNNDPSKHKYKSNQTTLGKTLPDDVWT